MAYHAPIMGARLRAPLTPEVDLTPSSRRAIANEIERLIALLDTFDGDCDLEPEEDFGIEDTSEGVGDHGRGLLPDLPRYGIDQSEEPINWRQAERTHQAKLQDFVPNGRGGWKLPS